MDFQNKQHQLFFLKKRRYITITKLICMFEKYCVFHSDLTKIFRNQKKVQTLNKVGEFSVRNFSLLLQCDECSHYAHITRPMFINWMHRPSTNFHRYCTLFRCFSCHISRAYVCALCPTFRIWRMQAKRAYFPNCIIPQNCLCMCGFELLASTTNTEGNVYGNGSRTNQATLHKTQQNQTIYFMCAVCTIKYFAWVVCSNRTFRI